MQTPTAPILSGNTQLRRGLTAANRVRRLAGVAVGVLMGLILIALAAVILVLPALGYQRYVITGGSMTGTIDRGSAVFLDEVPVRELRVGDVITYEPPGSRSGAVTHRIIWAGRDDDGERAFRTKGDANSVRDPWVFTLDKKTQGRVAFSLPYVGYLFAASAMQWIRLAVFALPAIVIVGLLLISIWRTSGEQLQSRKLGALTRPPVAGRGR